MADSQSIVSDPFAQKLIRIKAAQLCRRSDFTRSDYDDLRQGMALYLLEKAHLFDPARGPLEAFVTNAVETWVKIELRYRARIKRRGVTATVSIEQTAVSAHGETLPLAAALGGADGERRVADGTLSPAEHHDLAEAVGVAMARLTRGQRDLLRHAAEHGVLATSREWTRRLGRPFSRRRVRKAIEQMRAVFEDAGLGNT